MNQVSCNRILEAIKQDDLALFSALTDKSKNLLFGRFPLLSLCYLYNAKRIINKFEPELLKVSNFNLVQENVEIYKKFKAVAGKSLRFYTKTNSIVSPLEMAAMLNNDSKVKHIFNSVSLTNEIVENLTKIYEYKKQSFSVNYNKLKLGFKPLSRKSKRNYKLGIILSSVFAILFGGAIVLSSVVVGLATVANPFKIYSESQLYKALNTNGHYVLAKDIELNNFNGDASFGGVLDGSGHTITVKGDNGNQLLSVNNGEVKNINLKYLSINKSLTTSFSFFVQTNNGTISNVKLSCLNANFSTTTQVSEVLNISGLATNNNGIIKNCEVEITGVVNANGGGETFVCGIAGNNINTIKFCEMVAGNIETVEADVAGICANNEAGAVVEDCKNRATLKQTSSHNEWNPTVAGIVLGNYGKVANSRNEANLQVVSNNQFDNAAGSANLGGVAGYNYGEINKCKNTGNLNVETKNIIVYCGGIVADSQNYVNQLGQAVSTAKVLNCGVECEIDVETAHKNAIVFSGGIAGFLMGEMDNCFSMVDFKTAYNKDKYYVGITLGATYYYYWENYFDIEGRNNYSLMFDGVPYQIGAALTSGQISAIGIELLDGRIITLTSADDIKNLEGYYE